MVVFRFSAKKGFRQLLLDCGHILSLYPFSPISITFTILLTTTTNYRNRTNYNNHTNTTLTFITITTTSAIITTIDLTSLSPGRYAVPGGVFPPTTLQLELYSSSVLEHSIHIDHETLRLQICVHTSGDTVPASGSSQCSWSSFTSAQLPALSAPSFLAYNCLAMCSTAFSWFPITKHSISAQGLSAEDQTEERRITMAACIKNQKKTNKDIKIC